MRRGFGILRLSALCLAGLGAWLPARAAEANLEYAVKAAFLVKFIPFIDWPADALASLPDITICVVGEDKLGSALDRAAAGQKYGDKPFVVRRMQALDPQASCQMLFVGAADPVAGEMVEALKDAPVVTVTDSGVHARGVIGFVLAENHVRFDIDDAAAAHKGLRFSSKLLSLAHAVKRREGSP